MIEILLWFLDMYGLWVISPCLQIAQNLSFRLLGYNWIDNEAIFMSTFYLILTKNNCHPHKETANFC